MFNPAGDLEAEIDLADFDIALENKFAAILRKFPVPPITGTRADQESDEKEDPAPPHGRFSRVSGPSMSLLCCSSIPRMSRGSNAPKSAFQMTATITGAKKSCGNFASALLASSPRS